MSRAREIGRQAGGVGPRAALRPMLPGLMLTPALPTILLARPMLDSVGCGIGFASAALGLWKGASFHAKPDPLLRPML